MYERMLKKIREHQAGAEMLELWDAQLIDSAVKITLKRLEAVKKLNMLANLMQRRISGNLENIGFAPEGKECLYNIEIMEELFDIVALGAGSDCKKVEKSASGDTDLKKKVKRCENVKDVDAYIQRIDEMIMRKRDLYGENG